jgi:hypothetical protein
MVESADDRETCRRREIGREQQTRLERLEDKSVLMVRLARRCLPSPARAAGIFTGAGNSRKLCRINGCARAGPAPQSGSRADIKPRSPSH